MLTPKSAATLKSIHYIIMMAEGVAVSLDFDLIRNDPENRITSMAFADYIA